jgi:putative flippase GtrA
LIRKEFGRFLLAGAANTVLTVVLFEGLRRVLPYLVAYSLAYVTGIVVSYLLGTAFVFSRRRTVRSAALFPLIYVAQYLLGVLLMWWLVERLAVDATMALFIVIAVSVPITFLLSRAVLIAGST